MAWSITERELPGWNERPTWGCFPDASSTWDPRDRYDYATERYHTESFFSPGGQACGFWATAFDASRGIEGFSEGRTGMADERERIASELDRAISDCYASAWSDEQKANCARIASESAANEWDAPGYGFGVEAGRAVRDFGSVPWLWIIGGAAALLAGAYVIRSVK